jgi:hypothetical protein
MLILNLALVIVTNLYVECVAIHESEADPPLIIDRDGMLALTVASQRVESVSRRRLQVIEPGGQIHILEFSHRPPGHIRRETTGLPLHEQLGGPFVREGLDHAQM